MNRVEDYIKKQNIDKHEFGIWEITVPNQTTRMPKNLGFFMATFEEAVDFAFTNGLGSDGFETIDSNIVRKINVHRIPKDFRKERLRLELELEELQYQVADKREEIDNVIRLDKVSFKKNED